MLCLLCSGTTFGRLAARLRDSADHSVVRCVACGLVQLLPAPSAAEVAAFYEQPAHSSPALDPAELQTKEQLSRPDTLRRASLVAELVDPPSRVLDVGCGYGFLVAELRKHGYTTAATEPSPIRRRVATAVAGLSVASDPAVLPMSSFHVICLFHVLEHVPNPIRLLQTLASLLEPSGWLIVEVPHVEEHLLTASPEYARFYWKQAHLSYFAPQLLYRCVEAAGLRVDRLTFVQRWGVDNFAHWVVQRRPQPITDVLASHANLRSHWLQQLFEQRLISLQATDTLVCLARPPVGVSS